MKHNFEIFRVFDFNNSGRISKEEWISTLVPKDKDTVTFEELDAFWQSNKAMVCKNPLPSWMKALKDSKKNSHDPDSDNSVDEADLIPVSAALSQMWFNMDYNRDGFTTTKEFKQIFDVFDGIDGAKDGKLQQAIYEKLTNETLLKICYESAIM